MCVLVKEPKYCPILDKLQKLLNRLYFGHLDCFIVVKNNIFKAECLSSSGESMCIARLRWAPSFGSSRVGFMHFPYDIDKSSSKTLLNENYLIIKV